MKRLIFSALASSVMLASCADKNDAQPLQPDQQVVNFSFTPYIEGPMGVETKTNVSVAETSNYLDVFIDDGEDIISIHQSKADDPSGFGSIAVTLNKTKTYHLYAIAHKGTGPASLDGGVILFVDNKVTDSFAYTVTFSPTVLTDHSCCMARIVGMFRVETTDVVPDEVTKFRFTIDGSGDRWDIANMASNHVTQQTRIVNLSSRNQDGTATFNIYILAANTTDTTEVDVVVDALDADDEVIDTHTFEDVPIKAGYKSTYRGGFFVNSSVSAGFSVTNDWQSFDVEEF